MDNVNKKSAFLKNKSFLPQKSTPKIMFLKITFPMIQCMIEIVHLFKVN